MTNHNIETILNYDPLSIFDDVEGGKTYRDFPELALAASIMHNAEKDEMLTAMGDSKFTNKLTDYQRLIESIGFEKVLELPFVGKSFSDEPAPNEKYFIYVNREFGILLDFDTYGGDGVNGGKYYYCIRLNEDTSGRVTSSGGFRDYDSPNRYWAGDHDCREAIRYKINRLRENGTFLREWPKDNGIFLWFLHYMDTKTDDYDYNAINKERIAMLPEWVRKQFSLN